jgi:biotin carboxyl carrier protein
MDPNAGGRVQAVHGGRIEPGPQGLPFAGRAVKRGEVLAFLRHHAEPYAVAGQQALLADLRMQQDVAQKRVERLEGLEGTVPRKELEAARAEVAALATRERVTASALVARETLVAPVTGVVARADVVAGQVVEPRDVLFEVIDPSRLLVEAIAPDVALDGRVAAAQIQGVPEASLRYLGSARSAREGVVPMTFAVQGSKSGAVLPLVVGQPVTLVVALKERINGFVLPAQAIVRNPANEPTVWIKSGTERFIPQPVQFQPLNANTVVVTQGLGADNRVVVQGAPLLAQIR